MLYSTFLTKGAGHKEKKATVGKDRIFPRNEDVFWGENIPVDIQKIKHIQKITGSQYLVTFRMKVILAFISII
jgi:hypothetical protein